MKKSDAKNYLDVLPDDKSREIFSDIIDNMLGAHLGMTPFQINRFVLNDVEYPTDYGRWKQARFELVNRYHQLIDIYYEMKINDVEIKIKERDLGLVKDPLKRELLVLEADQLRARRRGHEGRLTHLLNESNTFYSVYAEFPEFARISKEREDHLEAEYWIAKAKNNPAVFEERYGTKFAKYALGGSYQQYLDHRKKSIGLMPREWVRSNQKAVE